MLYLIGYLISFIVVYFSYIYIFTRFKDGRFCGKDKFGDWQVCKNSQYSTLTYDNENFISVLMFSLFFPITIPCFTLFVIAEYMEILADKFAKNNDDINK